MVAKKKKVAPKKVQEEADSIFHVDPFNGLPHTMMDDSDPQSEPEVKSDGPDISTLMARIDSLEKRAEQLHQTNLALMTQAPAPSPSPQTTQAPQIDWNNLPDPVLDGAAYAQELTTRIMAMNQPRPDPHAEARATEERLWKEFEEKNTEYAQDKDKVEFVARKVFDNARKKNIDLQKYVLGATDTFFEDVKTEYDRVFGKPETDNDDSDQDDEVDNSRSETVLTGGPAYTLNTKVTPGNMGSIVSDLHERQKKMGLF